MKILIPLFTVLQLTSARASIVGVMDSGTDMSHKELIGKTWKNFKEKAGNTDLDGDGLPGDVYGYDFTTQTANPFDPKYNNLITEDVKKFFLFYSHYETKKITPDELMWLKTHSTDPKLMGMVDFVGGYIHGTHVAGISTKNNYKSKIVPFKIIPTVYNDPSIQKPDAQKLASSLGPVAPAATIEEFKNELVKEAGSQIDEMISIHKVLNFHKVDVVNQSFGIGWNDAANFIKAGYLEAFNKEPNADELVSFQNIYFNKLITEGSKMFAAAPNTIFCIAAGNDSSDNDAHPDYPSSIKAENRIVVAATLGYSELADFSNFGATRVDVAAPGVAITSTAPMNNYIPLSGTSQATPFVTSTIAEMKDINPQLTVRQIIAIVYGTVDVKPWLRGKVVTSGIVNKERAKKAAELAKVFNIDMAVAKSKMQIADVPVTKSLGNSFLPELGFKLKHKRPSLLIGQ